MINNGVSKTSLLVLFIVFGLLTAYYVFAVSTQIEIRILGFCGNDLKEWGEQCDDTDDDGIDLGGATCESLGYSGGTLSCNPGCTFNTDECTPPTGGGRVYIPPESQVTFSGRAYPNSLVTLLKDAQIAATTIAGTDANFYITLTSLSAGTYIFAIYSEDEEGKKSSLFIIPLSVPPGATTSVSGIFIAPTIKADKSEVKKGEEILISGQSFPMAEIRIFIKSEKKEFFITTLADKNGKYSYNLDTSPLNLGEYQVTANAIIANVSSNSSKIIHFIVGIETIFKKPFPECPLKGDFNKDCLVNLVDFSILIYWFDRPNPPAEVDLDRNGKVNLIDFSIMAYYWTG